ncbi:MAG TPA: hypothetical protein VMA72_16995 [Streptosporangiaceae bacterium]|nr:hypothetical protein [Streptosporangiaceae bacterium]
MSGNKETVIEVLHGLSAEWISGAAGRWENVTIPAYLEAMAAWLSAITKLSGEGRAVIT